MSLSNLLEEMDTFAKASAPPADASGAGDDENILEAAKEGGATDLDPKAGEGEGAPETVAGAGGDAGDGDGQEGGEGKPNPEFAAKDTGKGVGKDAGLTKSWTIELENGEQAEVFDATEMIKSMQADFSAFSKETSQVMTAAFDLIKSQSAQITALKKQVGDMASTGRGRKTVISVTEKVAAPSAPLAKSSNGADQDGMTPTEFFAKASTAQKAGRITAADISVAEAYMNRGQAVPPQIVSRVLGG